MPKVIDLPTATTMDNDDYLLMEESTGGTKKITKANALSPIGDIVSAESSLTSITNNTLTELCQMTLPAGSWVITGQVRLNPGTANVHILAAISTTQSDFGTASGGLSQDYHTGNQGMITVGLTRVDKLTASTTYYLVAKQIAGQNISITGRQQFMKAIRIA